MPYPSSSGSPEPILLQMISFKAEKSVNLNLIVPCLLPLNRTFVNNEALDNNGNIDNMTEDISMPEVDDTIGVNIPRYCNEKHIKFSLDLFLFDF